MRRAEARVLEARTGRKAAAEASRRDIDALTQSTTWRMLHPVRSLAGLLPERARHALRRALRAAWWAMTLQLPQRLAARRATLRAHHTPPAGSSFAADYDAWMHECADLTEADRAAIRGHVADFAAPPLISVIMPAYDTPEPLLRAAIASVRDQLYPHWELCVADDASPSDSVSRVLAELAALDPRIRWVRREANGNISAATNSALAIATGEFVALMDHDDRLAEHALYEIAAELQRHPSAEMLYSDEGRFDAAGRLHSPYFKPDWDPDLILAQNMFSHMGVYRRSLLERINGLRLGFEGSQDHDLTLRAAAVTQSGNIRHVPAILYHWRLRGDASFSDTQLARCVDASRRAVAEHVALLPGGAGAQVLPHPRQANYHRIRWPLPAEPPLVSIIIPIGDHPARLEACVMGILYRTAWDALEILLLDDGNAAMEPALRTLEGEPRLRILPASGPSSGTARFNGAAVAAATGTVLVFLAPDLDVIEPDWLAELVSQALRPDVATVGARLISADGRVLHGGVVLGLGGGAAGSLGMGEPAEAVGYIAQSVLTRTVCANVGDAMAIRRGVFLELGGLDAANLPDRAAYLDLGLRAREQGFRNVFTPFAELLRESGQQPGALESPVLRERWGALLDHDPTYNANFSRQDHMHRLARPGRRVPPWLAPGLSPAITSPSTAH